MVNNIIFIKRLPDVDCLNQTREEKSLYLFLKLCPFRAKSFNCLPIAAILTCINNDVLHDST